MLLPKALIKSGLLAIYFRASKSVKLREVGASGAIVSIVINNEEEVEVLPAASVAVAVNE